MCSSDLGLNASGWKPCIHSGTYCPAYKLDMYLLLCLVLQPQQAASMQIQKPSGGGWRAQRSSKTNPHLVSGLPFTLAEHISLPGFGGCGCGCVCLWVGRVLHHSGMATFLVPGETVAVRSFHVAMHCTGCTTCRCNTHRLCLDAPALFGSTRRHLAGEILPLCYFYLAAHCTACTNCPCNTHRLFFPYVSPPFCGSTRRPLAGEPWQFVPFMWPCIVQGVLHVLQYPTPFFA